MPRRYTTNNDKNVSADNAGFNILFVSALCFYAISLTAGIVFLVDRYSILNDTKLIGNPKHEFLTGIGLCIASIVFAVLGAVSWRKGKKLKNKADNSNLNDVGVTSNPLDDIQNIDDSKHPS